MISVRLGTAGEAAQYIQGPGYSVTLLVLEEDGARAGEVALSLQAETGTLFASHAGVRTKNVSAYAVLLDAARAKVRAMGFSKVYIHHRESHSPRAISMWERIGARPVAMLYELDVSGPEKTVVDGTEIPAEDDELDSDGPVE